ncbi:MULTISPECIES: hypothetical protein [Pseudonocardia]|uniref:Basic proline-rich protein n=2 Tax=Pseudonocardia TaxID=1847 RepID=A0A1Y2MRV4_PSEAH|nr:MULTISPECIES: hypothetical protein [Pseudonocardia]OSY37950.1 hypothetical protein BG845_04357 [Pseudonocardia autotrophica]TDN74611.1 hypothetical protein C8E95_3738 [Pseudonocardia autotrophica]BBG05382.1 hypothetical protein Pdca_65910 [Pseudonocardia autotrophica]GEC29028.1 hypothetical protein PSA01_60570 [Pseudonocardia saturnea]
MSDPTYRLLLELAGRVDDDLLATGRELVAVGEEGHALELLVAELVAGRVVLPPSVRLDLIAEAAARRIQPDADRCLPRGDLASAAGMAHRFTGSGPAADAEAVADALTGVPAPDGGWRLAWRTTPAGSAPGPLPHPLLLARTGGGGSAEVLTYQAQTALRGAGLSVSVEVLGDDDEDTAYHRAAREAGVPLPVGADDPAPSTGSDDEWPGTGDARTPDARTPDARASDALAPDARIPDDRRHAEPSILDRRDAEDDAVREPRSALRAVASAAPDDGLPQTDDEPDRHSQPEPGPVDEQPGPGPAPHGSGAPEQEESGSRFGPSTPTEPSGRPESAEAPDVSAPGGRSDSLPPSASSELGGRSEYSAQSDPAAPSGYPARSEYSPPTEAFAQSEAFATAEHSGAPQLSGSPALPESPESPEFSTPTGYSASSGYSAPSELTATAEHSAPSEYSAPTEHSLPTESSAPTRLAAPTGAPPVATAPPVEPPAPVIEHPPGDLPSSAGPGPAPGAGTFDAGLPGPDDPAGQAPADTAADLDTPAAAAHPAPRPSPPIRALRGSTGGDWFESADPDGRPAGTGPSNTGPGGTDPGGAPEPPPGGPEPGGGTGYRSADGPLPVRAVPRPGEPATPETGLSVVRGTRPADAGARTDAWDATGSVIDHREPAHSEFGPAAGNGHPVRDPSPHPTAGTPAPAPAPDSASGAPGSVPEYPAEAGPPDRPHAEHRLPDRSPAAPGLPDRSHVEHGLPDRPHAGPAPLRAVPSRTPARPATDEAAWLQDWASGAWTGDAGTTSGTPAPEAPAPEGTEPAAGTDDPTPAPGVPIVHAPAPPPSAPPETGGAHRPRHMLIAEDTTGDDTATAPADRNGIPRPSPQPRPQPTGGLVDRLSPTEQDLLQRLHEELAARETGGEPTPRNGTARADPG